MKTVLFFNFLLSINRTKRNNYIRMCNMLAIAIQNSKMQIVQLMFIVLPESEELLNSAKMS